MSEAQTPAKGEEPGADPVAEVDGVPEGGGVPGGEGVPEGGGASGGDDASAGDGVPAPIVVQCPQCAVPADPADLCCPSCHEDLAALVRLRYSGRIAFNDALDLLRAGRREAAVASLERAVAAEPGLAAAERLLAGLGPA